VIWKPEITTGDIITVVALLVAAVGFFLNFVQIRKDGLQKRAEHLMAIYKEYGSDPGVSAIYYKIQHQEFAFDSCFKDPADERDLDELLYLYDQISKLYLMRVIGIKDIEVFAYDFVSVYADASVRRYLNSLAGDYRRYKLRVLPFGYFQKAVSELERHYTG